MKHREADIDQILVKGGLKHEHSMLRYVEQLFEQLFFYLKKKWDVKCGKIEVITCPLAKTA